MARTIYVYIYTVHIRYFWLGNHQIYDHIRCIYPVLAIPINTRKRCMHLLRVGEEARSLEKAFGIAVLRHKDKKPAGGKEDVEAHFGCEAHELVMVGDRCVCIYVCVCAVCM